MAAQVPEQPDVVSEVKADAATANSVPALRDQVVKLAEAVAQLQAKVARLEGRRR